MKMTKKFDKLNETFNVDSDLVSIDVESETVTEKIEKVALVVDDVKKEDNYISCNINVKSEIVVPLFVNNKNIGQIDIDSNTPSRFTIEDLEFLKNINILISNKI